MNAAEIQQWATDHGGLVGQPQANASGDTTYRAASGDTITVRKDGSLAGRGFSPPAAGQETAMPDQPPATPQTPAVAPGSGAMTQQQLEALLAQIAPNGDVRRLEPYSGTRARRVQTAEPSYTNPNGTYETVQVPYVGWIDRGTGHVLEAEVEPGGGSYTVTKNGVERNEQGAAATTGPAAGATPRQSRVNPADTTKVQEYNPDTGKWEDAGPNQAGADAAATRQQNAATAAAASRRADSAEARQIEEAKRPDTKTEFRVVGGQQYLVSVTTPKDGSAPSIRYFGPDGKPIDRIPSEGAATAGTRKLPDFVNQAASAGLVQVWEGLQADPTLTPEQRAKAFQEAVQIATLAQTNANNEELHRQSERNAASNEAKYRLDYQQTGLGQALDFVNGIIKSGSGSQAGGAAFAAIMGLQLLQMQASGINDLGTNAAKPAPLPVVPPAALTNKGAAQAAGQAVSAHIDAIFKPPPPVVGPVGPPAAAQNAGSGTGEPPARGAIPTGPAAPSAPPPTAGGPPLTQDYPVLATPPTAAAPAPPPDAQAQATSDAARWTHVQGQLAPDLANTYASNGINPATGEPIGAPPPPAYTYPPPADPSLLQPGVPTQVPGEPPGVSVPYPDSAGAESKILPPGQDYAVFGGRPPSDLYARAASKPIWRMTPEEYGQYVAAGVPEAIIRGVPGAGSAA